jgi:hypothetical protein
MYYVRTFQNYFVSVYRDYSVSTDILMRIYEVKYTIKEAVHDCLSVSVIRLRWSRPRPIIR